MAVEISFENNAYTIMLEHLRAEYPNEGCGLLLGKMSSKTVDSVVALDNSLKGHVSRKHFFIEPLELYKAELKAQSEGKDILGFYHSHPDKPAIASEEDLENMLPGMTYVIASVFSYGVEDVRLFEIDSRR